MSSQLFMLAIEKNVVMEVKTFDDALCVLFASYFNFNIQYPECAGTTLEFLQRYVLPSRTNLISVINLSWMEILI